MQAIILAAGMGKRLKELTRDVTKCMVKVNGVTLIERTLSQLDELSLSRIVIVAGFGRQKLKEYVGGLSLATPVFYVDNEIYDKTNNIYSLYLAREYLAQEDTLLLESDIIFEPSVLKQLLDNPYPSLALVDRYAYWMDGTVVTLDREKNILRFIDKKEFSYKETEQYYKTVNIYKFSREFSCSYYIPFLEAYCKALGHNEYYEQVLKVITLLRDPQIKGEPLNGEKWYEIDDAQDLDIAETMFAEPEERLTRLQKRYGGYWRYPGLLDFCYLVNPFFPPGQMREEMKASFETLLTNYPSGMAVNSMLAAKCFDVRPEQIVTGNGAAELIKALMEKDRGSLGMALPTFEEYPNRKKRKGGAVESYIPGPGYMYTEDDLIAYYQEHPADTVVVVNPDNPSGNYICKEGLLKLARWAEEQHIRLIVDESFGDFADEEDNTLLKQEILDQYPSMAVVKSISKSFGVPGLRLGILASSDEGLLQELKKDVAIWNINSFGEFFLQIFEKYRLDYQQGMKQFRKCRRTFVEGLTRIPGIRVLPSQANYVMCALENGMTSRELAVRLLDEDHILIKDLSGKAGLNGGQYIRLAVRLPEENILLLRALARIL